MGRVERSFGELRAACRDRESPVPSDWEIRCGLSLLVRDAFAFRSLSFDEFGLYFVG
jgi:hypothetical protein